MRRTIQWVCGAYTVACSFGLAADPIRVISHPKIPCGVVQGLVEVSPGVLYIGCRPGLYKFDGFRYEAVPGYPLHEAGAIRVTDDGAVWVVSNSEGLARRDPRTGRFQVMLRGQLVDPVSVGNYVFAKSLHNDEFEVFDSANIGGPPRRFSLKNAVLRQVPWLRTHAWATCPDGVYRIDTQTLVAEKLLATSVVAARTVPDSEGRVWIVDAKGVSAWKNGVLVVRQETSASKLAPYLTAGRNGQVWMQTNSARVGLSPFVALPELEADGTWRLHEDSRGHIWVASDPGGLWEIQPPIFGAQWPKKQVFNGANPVQLLRNRDGELLLATKQFLFRFDEKNSSWQPLPGEARSYQYVLPVTDGTLLASVFESGLVRLASNGKLIGRVASSDTELLRRNFRKLALFPGRPNDVVAIGNRLGYLEYRLGADAALKVVPMSDTNNLGHTMPLVEDYPEVTDFETAPDGRLWMGFSKGLAWWDPGLGGWREAVTSASQAAVGSLAFGANGDIWVARLRSGFDRVRTDGTTEEFRASDGYFPDDTDFLKVDRRGWIWRGTERGVWVSDGKNVSAADWIFLEASGECAQYGFFEDTDGSVWIAGDQGVTHLRPDAAWFRKLPGAPPTPRLSVDGQLLVDGWRDAVKQQPKSVQFDFAPVPRGGGPNGVLHSGAVQYRLLPRHQDWRWSETRKFEYADLSPGSYRLEVRQAGYLQPFVRELRIGIVPWFRGWMLLLPLAGIAAWLYRQREKVRYRLGWAWFLLRRWKSRRYWDAERQDLSGRLIKGRYRLVRLASTGGFSQVYEAIDQGRDGTTVAVKMLFHRSSDAGWVRDRFTQEVSALQLIDHPGVVALTDFWIQPEGEPCLAMTFLDGPTLRETLVSGNPWPLPKVAQFVKSLGETLAFVHQAGVLHRDLKPENIVLHDGRPTVVDFGSSGLLGRNEPAGVTRLLTGSIEYLAPERLTGHYSTASDIYSLGAIAFELLTGEQLATSGVAIYGPNLAEALREALPASCREDVATVLAESLRPVPEQRPQDAGDWAKRLADAIERSA